jgi:hypothetical protein
MSSEWARTQADVRLRRLTDSASPIFLAVGLFLLVRLFVGVWLFVAAQQQGRSAYRLLTKWDSQWYAGIAADGYGFVRLHADGRLLSDYAFFPLFPLVERFVAGAFNIRPLDAGVIISSVASVAAAAGIFVTANHVFGARTGVVATVLWGALPVGVVQSMAYSESLFTALAAWSLYAVLTRRWLLAGILACLAGLTRPISIVVIAAVVVAAIQETRRTGTGNRTTLRPLLAAAIAPLGLLGYVVWVSWRVGSPTGYFDVASGWGNGFDGGVAFAQWIGRLLTGSMPLTGLLVISGVVLLAGLVFLCLRQGQPLPLLIFVGALVTLALTTSGYFGSKPRYLLPAFPLLFPLTAWLAERRASVSAAVLASLTLVAAAYGAFWLLGPGPP